MWTSNKTFPIKQMVDIMSTKQGIKKIIEVFV